MLGDTTEMGVSVEEDIDDAQAEDGRCVCVGVCGGGCVGYVCVCGCVCVQIGGGGCCGQVMHNSYLHHNIRFCISCPVAKC